MADVDKFLQKHIQHPRHRGAFRRSEHSVVPLVDDTKVLQLPALRDVLENGNDVQDQSQ